MTKDSRMGVSPAARSTTDVLEGKWTALELDVEKTDPTGGSWFTGGCLTGKKSTRFSSK